MSVLVSLGCVDVPFLQGFIETPQERAARIQKDYDEAFAQYASIAEMS